MSNLNKTVVNYFRPPENYFWRWAENGHVIEWRNGQTICYREELVAMLKHLSNEGLPSLGAVLLVLSACKDDWKQSEDKTGILQDIQQKIQYKEKNLMPYLGLQMALDNALRFLNQVNSLQKAFRTGEKRNWLLRTVFEKEEVKIKKAEAQEIIDEFNRGRFDRYIFKNGLNPPGNYFEGDLEYLNGALKEFPSTDVLELKIKTGLDQLPQEAALETAEPTDLLQQLERDVKTAGLANLTQRLIAALHIPMHAQGSSDQLFGGVSDITNRGNFDRLLLSELAHDDLSLMARLANNEALYLRREELPSNLDKQQVILIDTTIKMWGLPRVFAISAALACIRNNKTKATVESYALSGNQSTKIDLATKQGVINTLSQLDAAMHCGRSLTAFMHQRPFHEGDEFFLITEEDNLHSIAFQGVLANLDKPLNFLVTVNRNGHLQFYEYVHHRRKLVSEARFDLDELLFSVKKPEKKVTGRTGLPAFLNNGTFPLFFPSSKVKFNNDRFAEVQRNHLVCVTLDQRVLYWNNRSRGAREVIGYIEKANYCMGMGEDGTIYIVAYNIPGHTPRLYKIVEIMYEVEVIELGDALPRSFEIVYDGGESFCVYNNEASYILEAGTGQVKLLKEQTDQFKRVIAWRKNHTTNFNPFKKIINNGYTVINTVRTVYVNDDKELGFDDRHISFRQNSNMIIVAHNRHDRSKNSRPFSAKLVQADGWNEHNEQVKYTKFAWADGSEVLADSRGFLYLRSSDQSIPHIIILTIMGKPTACWASDGGMCGPEYFTGVPDDEVMDVENFHKVYIERFINTILDHAA